MRRIRYFALGLLLAVAGGALAVTAGGFPYLPTFGGVTISAPSRTANSLTINNKAVGGQPFIGFATASVATGFVGSAGQAADLAAGSAAGDLIVRTQGGRVRLSTDSGASSADISPADSATLTWSFQIANTVACSVNGTDGTFVLHKIGKVVVVKVLTSGNCTMVSSTSLSTNNTPIPAAFRPALTSVTASPALTGTSNPLGQITIGATGNLTITLPAASTTVGIPAGTQFSYTLD
jgi:hypothetical protein